MNWKCWPIAERAILKTIDNKIIKNEKYNRNDSRWLRSRYAAQQL